MTTRIQRPLISPVLIERDRELEAIAQCLERAETGLQTVTIAGEAGLGKTRLGREAAALATQRGWLALEAGCAESDRVLELAPVRDLLHQLVAASSPEDVGRYLGSEANELVALFPELADHEEPAPTVAVPAEGRQHLFRALVRFLIRVSRSHPLLLLMEDIHWSDESTLELLLCLARMARSERILVLATYRSDSVGEGLAHFLAELDRERVATELSLGRLTRSGVASMVKAVLSWDRPAPTALLDRLYTLTEGNPFFIEEVLKVLTMQGEVASEERVRELSVEVPTIPRTVQATIEARIALLSPGARRVLLWAATIGRRFDFAFLSVLEGIQEEQLLAVLRELVAAQLIVEVSADRFALRHALIGEAVQARMLRRERRHLHLRVADAMERFYAEDLDQHLADVAEHYYRAQAWSKVLEYAQRLGSRAQALHAPRAAIDCFTRALEAARHLGASEPLALYRARGRAYEAAGEFDAARQDLERALNVSRMTDDQAGAWQSLIDLGLLWCARDYDRAGDYFRSALDLARELGDPARLGHSLNRLGNWHMNREEMGEALRRHEEALHIFRNCGDQRGTAETLDLLGMTACISGDSSRGRSYYEEAISLFREMDDRLGLASALATMSGFGGTYETDTVVPRMRSAEAVRAGEEAVRVAGEINWRSGEAYAQLELAFCLGSVGEYARAFELGHAALALSDEIGHQQWLSGAHAALGALYLDVLSAPAAREHLEQALAVATEVGSMLWARQAAASLASTMALLGELRAAESLLARYLSPHTPADTVQQRLMWCTRAELHLARREADAALRIIETLFATARNLRSGDYAAIPRLAKLRGDALALLHRPGEAEAALRSAREAAMTRGLRPLLWRTDLALGRLLRAQRRYEEADAALGAARSTIDDLATELLDRSLRESFVQAAAALLPRTRSASPRRAAKEAFGGLTPREREVAGLIAEGKTNREIAEHLLVAEVTVATHVGHILAKLEFSSRAQIAAWAADKGIAKSS